MTTHKTTNLIFPEDILSADIGSAGAIANKDNQVPNILKIKAAKKGFEETNLTVVTQDGRYYSFLLSWNKEPHQITHMVKEGEGVVIKGRDKAKQATEKSREEKKEQVQLPQKKVAYLARKVHAKHRQHGSILERKDGLELELAGIYVEGDVLFLHFFLKNTSNISYDIDYIHLQLKKKGEEAEKEVSIQPSPIHLIHQYPELQSVRGKTQTKWVCCIRKLAIAKGEHLLVELWEKQGGRHLALSIEKEDIIHANRI